MDDDGSLSLERQLVELVQGKVAESTEILKTAQTAGGGSLTLERQLVEVLQQKLTESTEVLQTLWYYVAGGSSGSS